MTDGILKSKYEESLSLAELANLHQFFNERLMRVSQLSRDFCIHVSIFAFISICKRKHTEIDKIIF
jgi:hypothetical protein